MRSTAGLIKAIAVFAVLLHTAQAYAAISVTPQNITTVAGANAFRDAILGTGVTAVGNASGSGSTTSAGTFTGGVSSGIGIDSGILLTSGYAGLVDGTNTSDSSTGIASSSGDANLNALGQGTTTDTTYLQFAFQFGDGSVGGDLFFNYVFASEEYNEYAGSGYNDLFAFFLDGSNVALIPSTSTPVAINTVNQFTNSAYFNNNDASDSGNLNLPFEYDGFTDVFQVSASGLGPGVHTIKLVISDVGDQSWDSGVFIQGGTFSTDPGAGSGAIPEATQLIVWIGLAMCAYPSIRKLISASA